MRPEVAAVEAPPFDAEDVTGFPDDAVFELLEFDSKERLLEELETYNERYELYHLDHASREYRYETDYHEGHGTTYTALVVYGGDG